MDDRKHGRLPAPDQSPREVGSGFYEELSVMEKTSQAKPKVSMK
jgi:hypothetical protein